jgi:O-antigen/teichoic acid export membrane protein
MSIDAPVLEREPVAVPPVGRMRTLARRLAADADLRRSVLSVFDQAVVSGTNFATSVLIGRLCTQTELGLYYLALSVWLCVRGVQEQLVVAPYMIYSPRRSGDGLASYFGSSLVHNGLLTVGALGGLAGLAVGTANGFGPAGLATTAWVLLGAVPFLMLREFVRHYAFSHLRIGMAIAIDVVVSTLQLGGLLWLGWTGALTVANAYAVIGGACAVASLGWFLARPQAVRVRRRDVVADWRHNWVFARWALACHLFTSATPLVMPWVVAFANGAAATGVLAACTTIIGLANVFVLGLANFLSPKAAHAYGRGGVDELGKVLRKTLLLFGATLGSFAILALFAGGLLVTSIYGDRYAGAGTIVAVLAFATLASSVGITAGNGLWAMEKPSANFRADVAAFVAAVLATVLLVPPFGVLGAAIVTLIANVVDAAVRSWTLRALMAERRGVVA